MHPAAVHKFHSKKSTTQLSSTSPRLLKIIKGISLILIIFSMESHRETHAKGSMAGKLYTPKLIKEATAVKLIGAGRDLSDSKHLPVIPADIKDVIYPMGVSGLWSKKSEPFISLKKGSWFFSQDGIAVIQLQLRPNAPEVLSLTGKLTKINNSTRLHAETRGLYGLKVTLDGILQPTKTSYLVSGFLTTSVRGITQIEQFDVSLSEEANPVLSENLTTAVQRFQETDRLKQALLKERRLLSEPSETIGGVSLPITFDVNIVPTIDNKKLDPMKGQLLLWRSESTSEPNIQVSLSTTGSVSPGWSTWRTSSVSSDWNMLTAKAGNTSDRKEQGVRVAAENSNIRVSITPVGYPRDFLWQTKPAETNSTITSMIYAEEGIMNLKISDDKVSGSISARGTEMAAGKPMSTFTAELSGERQAENYIKQIKKYIGASPFSGRWLDARFGVFSLNEKHGKVTGSFGETGSLQGEIQSDGLDLIWQKPCAGAGGGFLTSHSNGLLIGMLWQGNDLSTAYLVNAAQAIPQEKQAGNPEIPSPKTDAEARELKWLGYDFYFAGKYQEAANALEKVMLYFSQQEKSAIDPALQSQYLQDQSLTVFTLISSADQAGDYTKLVTGLANAIDIEQKSGKSMGILSDSADFRIFQDQVKQNIEDLGKQIKTINLLADSISRAESLVSAGGIGVMASDVISPSGLLIAGVQPDMPAIQAGVMAGDIITVVNGTSIAGMAVPQAIALLKGKAGSTVFIKVVRKGQSQDLRLTRKPIFNLDTKRKLQVLPSLVRLQKENLLARDGLQAELNRLQNQLLKASDVQRRFKEFTRGVDLRIKDMVRTRTEVIASTEQVLAGSPIAISLYKRFVVQMQELQKKRTMSDPKVMASLLRLDQDVETFESNAKVSKFDKEMLKLGINLVNNLDQVILASKGRLKLAESAEYFAENNLPAPSQTSLNLALLGQWLDNWRTRMATDAAKISSLNYGEAFYVNHVNTLIKLRLPAEALQASESARARAFTDLLAARDKIKPQLNSPVKADRVFSYESTPPLSLKEIKSIAAEQGGVVIEYYFLPGYSCELRGEKAKDCLAIWIMQAVKGSLNTNISLVQVPVIIDDLKSDVNRLMALMDQGLSKKAHQQEASRLLRSLHAILIEPLEKEKLLPDDSKGNSLVTIIPQGVLFSVPFAALMDGKRKYMVEKYALKYATALSVLKYTKTPLGRGQIEHRNLLSLASPNPLPTSEEYNGRPLIPLADTLRIAQEIAKLYSPGKYQKIFTGIKASEQSLSANATRADVIYFGTHAEVKSNDPLNSFIALAKTEKHNGYLRAFQIANLNLRAELVILAACETARGELSNDGINGLSRAFTQAGASALLASLWKVPENHTGVLMLNFHDSWLRTQRGKAESLQNAQRILLNSSDYREQPNLWSAFVLYGRSD